MPHKQEKKWSWNVLETILLLFGLVSKDLETLETNGDKKSTPAAQPRSATAQVMFLVLMDATVLPYQLTFKTNFDPDDFDAVWLWITTLIFGLDVATGR